MFGRTVDTLTLARNARKSPEMIDRFYASQLQGEMNVRAAEQAATKALAIEYKKILMLEKIYFHENFQIGLSFNHYFYLCIVDRKVILCPSIVIGDKARVRRYTYCWCRAFWQATADESRVIQAI